MSDQMLLFDEVDLDDDDEFIPDEVISDFYKLADALLFPSFEEGFGIPILEAGFAGIPVFCSDILPLKKLGGEFVSYFSPEDKPDVVAKMMTDYFKAQGYKNPETETLIFAAILDGTTIDFVMAPETFPLNLISQELINRYCNLTNNTL